LGLAFEGNEAAGFPAKEINHQIKSPWANVRP
jgi:hypothetical protein